MIDLMKLWSYAITHLSYFVADPPGLRFGLVHQDYQLARNRLVKLVPLRKYVDIPSRDPVGSS